MRYTNSEKISRRYLDEEKEKIQEIFDANPYPFMKGYLERFESIDRLEERYEQLRKYMHLYQELLAFVKSDAFTMELAKNYVSVHCEDVTVRYFFFNSLLERYPITQIGCLTELHNVIRKYYMYLGNYTSEFITQYWYYESAVEWDSHYKGKIDAVLKGLMKIPDEEMLAKAFAFIKRAHSRFCDCELQSGPIKEPSGKRDHYFDLRKCKFHVNEIVMFNPEDFRFSDYTFDRDDLAREWPQYLIDERVPFELRNAIYEVNPVWFMQAHAQYFVFKYLPYFTPEILKRISRIFKLGYDVCIPGEPKLVYEIVQLLIAWYEADPKWYDLVHEECI